METNARLRSLIQMFAQQLREEFGPQVVGNHSCLLEAAEEWGVQVGDELARAATQQEVAEVTEKIDEACCPQCGQLARWKGHRKRRIETRRGAIHVPEPEYYCPRCRRAFFPGDPSFGDGA